MTPRTFSDDQYAGAYVRFPVGIADRLVVAAHNSLQRQARYADPDADPDADPCVVIGQWLDSLEQARVSPTPAPEPGDVLVKQDRGEIWMHDRIGWRELAPVELQSLTGEPGAAFKRFRGLGDREFFIDPIAAKRDSLKAAGYSDLGVEAMSDPLAAARQTLDDARHERREHERAWTQAAGKVADPGFAGVASGPPPRFWPKSVVEEHLERKRDFERLWPPIKKCADELLELHQAIDVTLEAADHTDLGMGARTLRAFNDGVELSRKMLLDTATRELGGYTDEADDD